MDVSERRRAARVPCEVPVGFVEALGGASVIVVDLSRTGLRVRVALADLDLPLDADLTTIWQQVSDLLAGAPTARLHPQILGCLVSRRVQPIRLIPCAEDPAQVELGCRFDRALTAEEVAALNVPVPAEDEVR